MKLGLLSYTNRTSGVGCVAGDLFDNVPVDSMFSVRTIKGQEQWLARQVNGIPDTPTLTDYLRQYRPDILLSIETLFCPGVEATCREHGCRTVLMVMQESYYPARFAPDIWLCPTRRAWDKVEAPNKVYFSLPIDVRPFTFRKRTVARRFLHIMGYGSGARAGRAGSGFSRRQTREVCAGFCAIDSPDISLTVHCQEDWRGEYGECLDPRVTFRLSTLPTPAAVYEGFDVLIQPDAYAGYNRVLLEAKACGMPVITTDAPPMNELVTDAEALIPARAEWYDFRRHGANFGPVCFRYLITADGVTDAVKRVLQWDIPAKSLRARKCAKAHAWTDDKRADFVRLLESLL